MNAMLAVDFLGNLHTGPESMVYCFLRNTKELSVAMCLPQVWSPAFRASNDFH